MLTHRKVPARSTDDVLALPCLGRPLDAEEGYRRRSAVSVVRMAKPDASLADANDVIRSDALGQCGTPPPRKKG